MGISDVKVIEFVPQDDGFQWRADTLRHTIFRREFQLDRLDSLRHGRTRFGNGEFQQRGQIGAMGVPVLQNCIELSPQGRKVEAVSERGHQQILRADRVARGQDPEAAP